MAKDANEVIAEGTRALYIFNHVSSYIDEIEKKTLAEAKANFRLPADKREPSDHFMAKLCVIEELKMNIRKKIMAAEKYEEKMNGRE